jgi:hypothetical protein
MKITIEFDTDNAAFDANQRGEVNRILQLVGGYAYEYMQYREIRDWNNNKGHKIVSNGSTIGKFKIKI